MENSLGRGCFGRNLVLCIVLRRLMHHEPILNKFPEKKRSPKEEVRGYNIVQD
jgi:hypothetical protein